MSTESRLTAYQVERIAREAEAERVKALYAVLATPTPVHEAEAAMLTRSNRGIKHEQTETLI